MRTILVVLILVSNRAFAQTPPDGFYLKSADDSAPFAVSQYGDKIPLGSMQNFPPQGSSIHSEDNANSRFWISLGVPRDVFLQAKSCVLVVAGHAYPWAGSASGPGTYEVAFKVAGADNARDVSRFLNAPIEYKRHPGHQLLVSFMPTQPSFRVGDDVRVRFRIENIGTNTISFMQGGRSRSSSRDNQYTFSASFLGKQVPDIGSSIHMGGIAVFRVLETGEVFEDEISLRKWFAFDKKGLYEVFGSYELTFKDPSNETRRPIWTDYVSSGFSVRVD